MKLGLIFAVCAMIGCTSSASSVSGTPDCNASFHDPDWGHNFGEQVQLPASTPNVDTNNCVPIEGWYCCVSSASYSPFSQ